MPDFQTRTIKIPGGKGKLLTEILTGIGNSIGIDKTLLVIRREHIQLLLLGIVETKPKPMPEVPVGIRLVVIQLELAGITGDQPGRKVVVAPCEIIMGEF